MSQLRATLLSNAAGTGSPAITGGELARMRSNLNGTGVINLDGGFNVASVVDNGLGDYSYNFSVAFPNINYTVSTASYTSNVCVYTATGVSFLVGSIRPGAIGSWSGAGASNSALADGRQLLALFGDAP